MARKDDQNSAQFDTGFGATGGTFGGSAGGAAKSQAAQGGEFSSGFGGGTNAVSQIFRDGGASDDRSHKIKVGLILGIAVTAVAYSIYYFVLEEGDSSVEVPVVTSTPEAVVTPIAEAEKPIDLASTDGTADKSADESAAAATESAAELTEEEEVDEDGDAAEEGEELLTAAGPATSSSTYQYSEVGGGPIVTASAGTSIEVSRSQDFSVIYISGVVGSTGQIRIPNPPPGKVYWRVAGQTESTEITVLPPPTLNIAMRVGASIAMNETLQWSADGDVGHYRVEFSGEPTFGNIVHSLSTNQNKIALSGIDPGNYFIRVGGLNVASGRWEYTRGSSVEVK
ncbi:MAG: hypothetical protein RJB13_1210 [Pseudomonadota bacterium]